MCMIRILSQIYVQWSMVSAILGEGLTEKVVAIPKSMLRIQEDYLHHLRIVKVNDKIDLRLQPGSASSPMNNNCQVCQLFPKNASRSWIF